MRSSASQRNSTLSKEQELIKKTIERIRQELLNRTAEVEVGEWTHQNITVANTALVAHYQNLLGILRAHKELGNLIHAEVKETERVIGHYQAIEGHSYEQLQDSKVILDNFLNLATVTTNLETILSQRIDELEAELE